MFRLACMALVLVAPLAPKTGQAGTGRRGLANRRGTQTGQRSREARTPDEQTWGSMVHARDVSYQPKARDKISRGALRVGFAHNPSRPSIAAFCDPSRGRWDDCDR